MNSKKPAIPKDIETLKRDWWDMHGRIKSRDRIITELERKVMHSQKALQLASGLLIKLDAKRKEPGLLESLKHRLAVELLKTQTGMKVASGE
jgi:hypothetical protein